MTARIHLLARPETLSYFRERETHDTISHEVAARRHPCCHLWGLNKRAELRIAEHEVSRDSRAVRSVARRHRVIVAARDDLLYRALHAIRSDDKVSTDDLATRKRDVRPALDGRVRLHVAD
jgi:hypothetical protein